MQELIAKQTAYDGYNFRSRLEARWAVFFNECGVKWEYEPQGFDLGDGVSYLPDFLLHDVYLRGRDGVPIDLWVEVKGVMTDEDVKKIQRFSFDLSDMGAEKPVSNALLVVGNIPREREITPVAKWFGDACCDLMYQTYLSTGVNMFSFETIDGDYYPALPCIGDDGKFYIAGGDYAPFGSGDKRTRDAYERARKARFEWGEKP